MNHAFTVDPFTDSSPIEWWLHYLAAIAVPVLAISLAVAAYRMCRVLLRLQLPNLVEAVLGLILIAGAFTTVFLALNWHIELLYGALRQLSSATRATVAGLVAALILAAVSVVVAVKIGTNQRRWLAVIALAGAMPAVFSLVNDGLYRTATSAVHDTASVGVQSPTRSAAPSRPSLQSPVPLAVLPRSPPNYSPGPVPRGPPGRFTRFDVSL